ncbi:bifunctional diguanylate cyclase/phosphodiesterase [Altererythrobacter sp. B11]|uniref:putative bifunctional diguanylate cyclase/phosphodiesterase n=1 Tax=Altererythrobacter sp. B11 TaxID=2060312 RepID=UPI000DC6DF6D|nr:EAL domain-containing protein [Altererythrobacter sp. B11]BBC73051.1 bifunctional diguanylate cyclase/phosphodiesterase [Altererythrobacter sp. B11]
MPGIGFAVALVLFGLWSLWITAERSDLATRDRQVRDVHLAIGATLDELTQSQAGVAIWDPAVAELEKPKPDLDWLDQNVGAWLNYVFNHELDLILDGTGRPVYAMEKGVRVRPDTFDRIEPELRPLLDGVRGLSRMPANPHERLPNQPLHPDSSVRTSPAALHATDLVMLDGEAAAVSVMRMVPDSRASTTAPGSEPLLISVRYLNSSLMRELQRVRGIVGARVTRSPAVGGSGEYSVPLSSFRGQRIGYFTWRPEMPGKAILGSVLLQGGGALAALLVLLAGLIFRIGKLMSRDARSIAVLEEARLELQAKEAQAQYLANHDPLTGLPNRALFGRFVEEAIAGMGEQWLVGVMLIDLDRFKNVNDTLGHLAGDRLIQSAAVRLADCVGDRGIVARLGGDEFAMCLADCSTTSQIIQVAKRVLGELQAQHYIAGSSLRVSGSIGISVCEGRGTDRAELLRKADIAMYRAKETGGNTYRFFSPEMDESIASRQVIERDLRLALQTGDQLFVAYQPKLEASSGRIIGLEALVRWRHPARGELAPDVFIPVAEECGLIAAVGEWVLGEACRVAKRWPSLSVAVNVSPAQFRSPGLAASIRSIVRGARVRPQQIELEVTESILLEDDTVLQAALKELRSAKFRIALDDFGTGYSSLSYLKKFNVDSIKIDKGFVKRLGQDPEAIAIVQAVIALGHAMSLSVTAEGVETEEQRCLLRAAGCNELQGFLFSKPVVESELATLINDARNPTWPSDSAEPVSA